MKKTIQEIRGQYAALSQTLSLFRGELPALRRQWLERAPRSLAFIGCGSSYMVACSLRDTAASLLDVPAYAIPAGDLWLNCARYRRQLSGAMVVAVSRSGRTSEILYAAEALRREGVDFCLCSLAEAENTPLGEQAAIRFEMPWAFDESVCQTRSVTCLYAAGLCLIAGFAGAGELLDGLEKLAAAGPAYLERAEPETEKLAAEGWDRAVVLADGSCAGLANEGALAFQEIAQIPACRHHVLDVRHGPMVLIGEKTLVLAYLFPEGRPQQVKLLRDLQQKGARLLVYTNLPAELPGVRTVSLGTEVGAEAGAIAFLNLCQLTAYYKSLETGSDPDAPDGLDAWIHI